MGRRIIHVGSYKMLWAFECVLNILYYAYVVTDRVPENRSFVSWTWGLRKVEQDKFFPYLMIFESGACHRR